VIKVSTIQRSAAAWHGGRHEQDDLAPSAATRCWVVASPAQWGRTQAHQGYWSEPMRAPVKWMLDAGCRLLILLQSHFVDMSISSLIN